MRVPIRLVLAVALIGLAAFPPRAGAQVKELAPSPSFRWISTSAVDEGVVRGIVSDVDSGEPIAGVAVTMPGTVHGVLTDSAGHFAMATEYREKEIEVRAEMVGYQSQIDAIRMRAGRGVALHVSLRERNVPNCGLLVCSGGGCLGGVLVLVRDALTGGPPKGEVRLVVQSGELADTTTAAPTENEEFFWIAAGEMLGVVGPFDVEVQALGYEIWRMSEVLILPGRCRRTGASPPQYAWLLPAAE